MTNEFRYQNSINLSLGLIAAACALMAGALTAFFSIVDKVPHTIAGLLLLLSCILALLLCTASVVFGGRGISATLQAARAQRPPDQYDSGNFNRQAIVGALGVVAVVGMVVLSLAIKGEYAAEDAKASQSAERVSAETAGRLTALDSRITEVSQRIDRLAAQQDLLTKDVGALMSKPPPRTTMKGRAGARPR